MPAQAIPCRPRGGTPTSAERRHLARRRLAVLISDLLATWWPCCSLRLERHGAGPRRNLPLTAAGVRRALIACGHAVDHATAERVVDELRAVADARWRAETSADRLAAAAGRREVQRLAARWAAVAGRTAA